MRASIAFVSLAVACGPTVATDEDSTIEMPMSGETSTNGGDTTTGASAIEDACASADPAQCPEECYLGSALQVIDDGCGTTGVEVCLPGGPKPGVPVTTYWANAASGPVFAEYGTAACSVAARPDTWRECSGAVDEPVECACFCQAGYCRGDEDRRALDECSLESTCGPLWVDAELGAADHENESCILAGLAARTPGVYEIFTSGGFSSVTTRFYVLGDDRVARIEAMTDDVLECPVTSDWGSASTCMLASSDYFASCTGPLGEGEACVLDLGAWVSDCTAGAIACD